MKTSLDRLAEDMADLKSEKGNLLTSLNDKHFENGQLKSYTTFLNEKIYGLNGELTQANEEKLEQERRLLQQQEEILALRGERDRLVNMTAKLLADAEMGRLNERVSVLEKEKNASAIENETRLRAAEEEKKKLEHELQQHRQQLLQQQQQQEQEKQRQQQQKDEKKPLVTRNEAIVVGDQDGRYQICSLETGKCVQKPYGVGGLGSIELVSDELLATSSADFSISVWNVTSDAIKHSLQGHTAPVVSFALLSLPDSCLASGSTNGEIRIWNMATGRCMRTLIHYQEQSRSWSVFALKALPNRRLASGSQRGSVKIWNLDNGECIQEFIVGKRISQTPSSVKKIIMHVNYQNLPPVYSLALLTKQNQLAIGLEDATIHI